MRTWFTKNLGDAMLAGDEIEHIENLLLAMYAPSEPPGDVAVFCRHESDGRLHCELKAYFPPAAAALAQAVGAHPCARPRPDDLGLLAGTAACRASLFPVDRERVPEQLDPEHDPDTP